MRDDVAFDRVLVVEDEPSSRSALAHLLRADGYEVEVAADAFKAMPKLVAFLPDVLVSDLRLPGMDGLELARRALLGDPELVVIMASAYGTIDAAIAAFRAGAVDFLTKPIDLEHLRRVLERELGRKRARAEAGELRRRLAERRSMHDVVGESPPMVRLAELVHQVAPSHASVLITGESGTGKELVAEAIHGLSPRAARPFVKLHCAALAETLLESELFGHERGAFTGAVARRDGRFQQAQHGTLFLDEIGEISPATQVKLLRVLQERELVRVGGTETIAIDVRVIAATNRDLLQRVAEGRFREDLYYRLHVVSIPVPPLRERLEDVPRLARHFLRIHAAQNGRPDVALSEEALAALGRYTWPGNVRQLAHTIERAVVLCRGETIEAADLAIPAGQREPELPPIPGTTMAELERDAILRTLEHAGGSTARAAKILGVSTRMIQYRLHEWGIQARPTHRGRS